jgi:hypothetical protein
MLSGVSIARTIPKILGILLCVAAAHADVTIEEAVRVEGAGLMSMANMSTQTTTRISGNRSRIDSNMRADSGLVRMFAGGPTAEIVLLEQDTSYRLDLKKKRYTQTSLAEQRARMEQAMAQTQQAQQSQRQSASGVDEAQCVWSEPKSSVRKTGEKALIATFQAERVTITATQACTDKQTGQVCEFGLVLDQWLTPNFPAADESLAFHRAYAHKMGFNAAASRDFGERAETMFGGYKGIWGKVAAELKGVKGYPVKSMFALGVGGPQCRTAPSAAPPPQSGTAAAGRAIGSAIGSMFGKKKPDQPAAQPAAPPTIADGLIPLMSVSSELLSAQVGAVNADQFEVPANFKLAK